MYKGAKQQITPEEKEAAYAYLDVFNGGRQFAEERCETVSDQFIGLEVQIATILFAFVGLFISAFVDGHALDVQWAKWTLSFALACLMLSLVMGLLELKVIEKFWEGFLRQRDARFREWRKTIEGQSGFDEAWAYEEGSKLYGGANLVPVPRWPWIVQSVLLAGGVLLLFILAVAFIFGN